jgi:hypothetical protein
MLKCRNPEEHAAPSSPNGGNFLTMGRALSASNLPEGLRRGSPNLKGRLHNMQFHCGKTIFRERLPIMFHKCPDWVYVSTQTHWVYVSVIFAINWKWHIINVVILREQLVILRVQGKRLCLAVRQEYLHPQKLKGHCGLD